MKMRELIRRCDDTTTQTSVPSLDRLSDGGCLTSQVHSMAVRSANEVYSHESKSKTSSFFVESKDVLSVLSYTWYSRNQKHAKNTHVAAAAVAADVNEHTCGSFRKSSHASPSYSSPPITIAPSSPPISR